MLIDYHFLHLGLLSVVYGQEIHALREVGVDGFLTGNGIVNGFPVQNPALHIGQGDNEIGSRPVGDVNRESAPGWVWINAEC